MPRKKRSKKNKKSQLKGSPSKGGPCYINSVPDDILFEVFIALGLPSTMNPRMSATLTSVCKIWRSFILNTAFFWTEINNLLAVGLRYPKHLNPFERSKQALLNVTVDFSKTKRTTPQSVAVICDEVSVHSVRFQRLSIINAHAHNAGIIFDKWKACQMPFLQSLTVDISAEVRDSFTFTNRQNPTKPLPLPWISNSNTLRTLKLEGVDICRFPSLPLVSHLDIKFLSPTFESFDLISKIFPQLETLVFRNIEDVGQPVRPALSGRPSTHDLQDNKIFHKLRSLAICFQSIVKKSPDYALSHLSKIMKSLEYIEIVCTHSEWPLEVEGWKAFLHQWAALPNIRRVRVNFSHSSLWTNTSFVPSLPPGTLLEIDNPPLGSQHALMHILSLKNLGAITITLAQPSFLRRPWEPLNCTTFEKFVCSMKPQLCCPTILRLPKSTYISPSASKILGKFLTVEIKQQDRSLQGLILDTALLKGSAVTPPYFRFSTDDSDDSMPSIQSVSDSDSEFYWDPSLGPSPFDIDSD